jgi:hypothetical protein
VSGGGYWGGSRVLCSIPWLEHELVAGIIKRERKAFIRVEFKQSVAQPTDRIMDLE